MTLDTSSDKAYVSDMAMERYSFRFEEADAAEWKAMAKRDGVTLAEWIRRKCNGGSVQSVAVEDSAGDGGVGVAQRQPDAPRRSEKPNRAKPATPEDEYVADRNKHRVGCTCFSCNQTRRFWRANHE